MPLALPNGTFPGWLFLLWEQWAPASFTREWANSKPSVVGIFLVPSSLLEEGSLQFNGTSPFPLQWLLFCSWPSSFDKQLSVGHSILSVVVLGCQRAPSSRLQRILAAFTCSVSLSAVLLQALAPSACYPKARGSYPKSLMLLVRLLKKAYCS